MAYYKYSKLGVVAHRWNSKRLRQEDCPDFQARLGNKVRAPLKTTKQNVTGRGSKQVYNS